MLEFQKEKKESFLKIIARYLKYNRIAFVFIILIIIHIFIAVFSSKGLITRIKLLNEKKNLELQMQAEQKRNTEIKKEIDELNNSDKKIEQVAREKYGMTKDGEKIYKIKIDSTK